VKETMFKTISETADELEQWGGNSNTEDTQTLLSQIETFFDAIKEMDVIIQQDEEEAATEFSSTLKLPTKKTRIFGNKAHIRK